MISIIVSLVIAVLLAGLLVLVVRHVFPEAEPTVKLVALVLIVLYAVYLLLPLAGVDAPRVR